MKKSIDVETQKFIETIKVLDDTKYQILIKLREIIFDNYPSIKERIMYGGIMFSLHKDIAGLFVYENHNSLEFSDGYKFEDPTYLLEGKGKFRRHLKLRSLNDIDKKMAKFFVNQISSF